MTTEKEIVNKIAKIIAEYVLLELKKGQELKEPFELIIDRITTNLMLVFGFTQTEAKHLIYEIINAYTKK